MAKKPTKLQKKAASHQKQHSHPKHFLKVYWPYIPIIVIVVWSMVFGVLLKPIHAPRGILAYATNMSSSGLLTSTNDQRIANGLTALTINNQLTSAAQAKANDMVARNYWSHNTPDGQEPWVFINASGYVYQKAGENLAYGFTSSYDAVIGWMNSPSHKANILDTAYREVGFGYANSENFVGSGQQTVVVAMYGNPLVYTPPATPAEPVTTATPAQKPAVASQNNETIQPQSTQEPAAPVPTETASAEESLKLTPDRINQPITTDTVVPSEAESVPITRLQQLTNGDAPWSAILLTTASFAVVIIWLLKHALLVKRFVLSGEHFVAHHPVFDFAVVAIAAAAVYLSQSSGIVL